MMEEKKRKKKEENISSFGPSLLTNGQLLGLDRVREVDPDHQLDPDDDDNKNNKVDILNQPSKRRHRSSTEKEKGNGKSPP